MPIRMLKYASLIYEHYDEFPFQMVLYMEERDITIHSKINEKNLRYNYDIKDIREFDCSKLIESDDITDNIIAILCRIKDIDAFYQKLGKKESIMPFILDREIDPLYREGVEKGIEKGLEKGLKKVKEAKIVIAKALLKHNIDIEVVVKSTGLSKEKLEKLMPNQTK